MKYSILILYSTDRKKNLLQTLDFLKEMNGFDSCQVVISVDGKINFNCDYEYVEVKRNHNFYCWKNSIEAGIEKSNNDKIIYIDSDRILPKNYFELISSKVDDKSFVFPKYLYQFLKDHDFETIKSVRDNFKENKHFVREDQRVYSNPIDAIRRKNPMSGCVAFTKKGYYESGGFDGSFVGWGFPDIDFYMSAYNQKYNFIPIDCNELHLHHNYIDCNYSYSRSLVRLMGLYNGVKFCKKWNLPIHDSISRSAEELNIDCKSIENNLERFLVRYRKIEIRLL